MSPHGIVKFPLRIPSEILRNCYSSVEDAFRQGDHIYVARYADEQPELRGCSLILAGNSVGGASVLDRHDIRSARSFFYRAYAAWRDGHEDEAWRWLAEGRQAGGMEAALDRLEALMRRERFRIVFHSDYSPRSVIADYLKVPGIDVLLTYHAIGEGPGRLRFNASLKSVVPEGEPVDLVLIDGSSTVPVGVGDLGAPVVLAAFDQEWHYDFLPQVLPEVDWLALNSTTEIVEVGQGFGVDTDIYCNNVSGRAVTMTNLRQAFENAGQRPIDLLFTGGISYDFYQDKRQHLLSLYKLPDEFTFALFEGHMSPPDYYRALRSARCGLACCRYTNTWGNRIAENLTNGVVSIVQPEAGAPYLFSQSYDCFQVFREESAVKDIEKHLRRYPEILSRVLAQADDIEAELRSLSPEGPTRAQRYLRHQLFKRHVERADRPLAAARAPSRRKTVVPLIRDLLNIGCRQPAGAMEGHFDVIIPDSRPTDDSRASDWLRHALLLASTTPPRMAEAIAALDAGRSRHPRSLPLTYARALCHIQDGEEREAMELFAQCSDGQLVVTEDEPFPRELEKLHQTYWVMDARIRERCREKLAPLAPELAVWRSLALSHQATLAHHTNTATAATLAARALETFPRNDVAQRLLLRARYVLYRAGAEAEGTAFLHDFETYRWWDGLVFHDLAPLAIDILYRRGEEAAADQIKRDLERALARFLLQPEAYHLYPEAEEPVRRHGIPSGALRDRSTVTLEPLFSRKPRPLS
jgi:hypothetical protein